MKGRNRQRFYTILLSISAIMLLLIEVTGRSSNQFLSGVAFGVAIITTEAQLIKEYHAIKKRRRKRLEFVEFLWEENDKRS